VHDSETVNSPACHKNRAYLTIAVNDSVCRAGNALQQNIFCDNYPIGQRKAGVITIRLDKEKPGVIRAPEL